MVELGANTPQLKVVRNWIDAYCTLDMKNVEPLISKNFQYQALPETPDLPKETGGSHIERYRGLLVAASKLEAVYHEVIEAPGKVILHATSVATTVSGVALPYEALLILTLVEEDGELKILHCKDFADTRERNAFHTGAIEAAGQRVDA